MQTKAQKDIKVDHTFNFQGPHTYCGQDHSKIGSVERKGISVPENPTGPLALLLPLQPPSGKNKLINFEHKIF